MVFREYFWVRQRLFRKPTERSVPVEDGASVFSRPSQAQGRKSVAESGAVKVWFCARCSLNNPRTSFKTAHLDVDALPSGRVGIGRVRGAVAHHQHSRASATCAKAPNPTHHAALAHRAGELLDFRESRVRAARAARPGLAHVDFWGRRRGHRLREPTGAGIVGAHLWD